VTYPPPFGLDLDALPASAPADRPLCAPAHRRWRAPGPGWALHFEGDVMTLSSFIPRPLAALVLVLITLWTVTLAG